MNFIFKVNESALIRFVIPKLPEKNNYFFEPTEKLHKFDEVTIVYSEKNISVELGKDALGGEITSFHLKLYYVLAYDLKLPNEISPGMVGAALNSFYHDLESEDHVSKFIVWCSTKDTITIMYNANDSIYLEIAPLYHWHSFDPEPENENYMTFEGFMKSYKPFAMHIIPRETAKEWLAETTKILELIGLKEDDFIIQKLKDHGIKANSF